MTLVSPDLEDSSCFVTAPFVALGFPAKYNQKLKRSFLVLRTGGLCPCMDVET